MADLTFRREYAYAGSRLMKASMLATLLLVLFLYIQDASRIFRADRQYSRATFESVQRAAALQPTNALYQTALAQFYLYTLNDPQNAKTLLDRACRLDPYDARCWLDAAGVYMVLGDSESQARMIDRAVKADPTTPAVAWEATNFYLLQGEKQKALALAQSVVDNDPANARAALERCWRATHDIEGILRWTISPSSRHRGTLLQIVLDSGDRDAAATVWKSMVDSGSELTPSASFAYIDELIRLRDLAHAKAAWKAFLARTSSDQPVSEELAVNGGFERPILNGGFDWRYRRQDHINVELDDEVFHGGHNSIRFLFDQAYLQQADWFEYVPVEKKSYRFMAFARSEELNAAYGPRFEVRDAFTNALLFSTGDVLGTTPWREYSGDFTPPAGTPLVKISIGREEAHGALTGRLWVDDVSLLPGDQRK